MNKLKRTAMLLTFVLLLSVCTTALAMEFVRGNIPGEQMTFSGSEMEYTVLLGETFKEITDETKIVRILVVRNNGQCAPYVILTQTDTLLDAILDSGVGTAQKQSWGYSVVSMDGIEADYYVNGAWWGIMALTNDGFVQLETSVENTPLNNKGDTYMFIYQK